MDIDSTIINSLTPNYEPYRPFTDGVIIHSTAGRGINLEQEYQNTKKYFLTEGVGASCHLLIGPKEITRLVKDTDKAWHARSYNNDHFLSIELARPYSYKSDYTEFQYKAAAEACYRWHLLYDFPLERIYSQYERGLISHKDTEQGRAEKKQDPEAFRWDYFFYLIKGMMVKGLEEQIGEGFAKIILDNPKMGKAKGKIFHDNEGNGYVWTTNDYLLVWRKDTNECRDVQWTK